MNSLIKLHTVDFLRTRARWNWYNQSCYDFNVPRYRAIESCRPISGYYTSAVDKGVFFILYFIGINFF